MAVIDRLKNSVIRTIDRALGPAPLDMVRAGVVSADVTLLRTELLGQHRVRERRFIAELFPKGAVGAELGVFTGLFATVLLDVARPREMYFVDPWWEAYGPSYPDWGIYNDYGKLTTRTAHNATQSRSRRHAKGAKVHLRVSTSTDFLDSIPDQHLDWAYLDSTHTYEGTRDEVALLRRKLKPGAILAGDDWTEDPNHVHAGVARALKEALGRGEYNFVGTYEAGQWAVSTPLAGH
jgi:hypothetical protein